MSWFTFSNQKIDPPKGAVLTAKPHPNSIEFKNGFLTWMKNKKIKKIAPNRYRTPGSLYDEFSLDSLKKQYLDTFENPLLTKPVVSTEGLKIAGKLVKILEQKFIKELGRKPYYVEIKHSLAFTQYLKVLTNPIGSGCGLSFLKKASEGPKGLIPFQPKPFKLLLGEEGTAEFWYIEQTRDYEWEMTDNLIKLYQTTWGRKPYVEEFLKTWEMALKFCGYSAKEN